VNRNPNSRAICVLVFAAACLVAGAAHAQDTEPVPKPSTPPARPDQGLFQDRRRDTQSRDSLVISASAWGAYDSHVVGSDTILGTAPGDSDLDLSGAYTLLQAGLGYDHRARRWTFGSSVNSRFTFYNNLPGDHRQPIDSHDANATLGAELGRSQLRLAQSVGYQPYFWLQALPPVIGFDVPLEPVQGIAFSPEVSLLDTPAITYSSSASFTTPLGRRSSLGLTYGYQGGNYSGPFADLTNQSAGVEITRGVSRSTEVIGRYNYQDAGYERLEFVSDVVQHGVEGAFRHTRRLSATRTMRVYGGAGASILNGDFPNTTGEREAHQVTANGGLEVLIARSWLVQGEFRRSLQLLQGLAQPYYGNWVNFAAGGLLTRRVDVTFSGAYAQGAVGIDALSGSPGYNTRNASVRVRYAIRSDLAVSSEYLNSDYSFGREAVLPPGVIRQLNRHAIRVGLMWGASLMGRRARP